MTLDQIALYPLRASGGVSPSMPLGTMPTRPALLVSLSDAQGCTGWGEVWANFPPRANSHKQHLIEDVIAPKLTGFTFVDPREVNQYLRESLSIYFLHVGQEHVFEHILAGLDTALWDLALRSAGRSFVEHMRISADARCYASSVNPDDLEEKFTEHGQLGQNHFKLKLGFADEEDLAFVARAASICPTGSHIMVDSNQCWGLEQATRMLASLEQFDPLFAEEPIAANAPLRDWEQLARSTEIPLAAGENIYGIDNFLAMIDAGLTVVQPDVAKWGGISGALDLARALPSNISLWPHFMGTAVGQVASLSITASIGDTSVCEMDVNTNPLRADLCGNALDISAGKIALPTDPGLVVPPLSQSLIQFQQTTQ